MQSCQHSRVTPKVDQLAPVLLDHKSQHWGPQEQDDPTYMVMHPNSMPAHCSDEVSRHMAGLGCDMTFHSQEIIGDRVVDTGRHEMRCKLGEWKGIVVGQPQYRPTFIDRHQVPVGMHGPRTRRIEGRGCYTCFAGAQHLERGVLSQSIPMAKFHLVAST